ncbi:MAG: amino acid ABC transporter permease [Dehalococcoidia bacterium]
MEWSVIGDFFFSTIILKGIWLTIQLSVLSMIFGVALGVIAGVMNVSRFPLVTLPANLYIWFFRGTPLLIQLLFGFAGLPQIWDFARELSAFQVATIVLSLNQGAYMAEIVRAGIESIEEGQMDGAKSLGMPYLMAMRRVILPQALRVIIPPTGNQFIALLKDSSLASVITVTELLRASRIIYAANFRTLELLTIASIWYLVMTTIFSLIQAEVEGRMAAARREERVTLLGRLQRAINIAR